MAEGAAHERVANVRTNALSLRHLRTLSKRYGLSLADTGPNSIEEALSRGLSKLPLFSATRFNRRRTAVYYPATDVDRLLQYVVSDSIIGTGHVKQANRNEIVSNLVLLMQEPCDLRLYRFDINHFYESIDRDRLVTALRGEPRLPTTSVRILEGIFAFCKAKGIVGIPRGVSVSATLAEQYLQGFDKTLNANPDVFFYARFVDDILIVTSRLESPIALETLVQDGLTRLGLALHPKKRARLEFDPPSPPFEYLGYRFELIKKSASARTIRVDIATEKVKRFKMRVVRSLLSFNKAPDFDLLRDRVRVLTGNYVVHRRNEHQALRAGMYYSYPHLTDADAERGALRRLDQFLLCALTSRRLEHSRAARVLLSSSQRAELVKMSFRVGHKERRLFDCGPNRLEDITRIWKHV